MSTIRVKRLERELFKLFTNVITYKLRDKRLDFVTVSKIRLSQDFSHCKIYFTHLSEYSHDIVLRALIKSSGFFKREIAAQKFMRIIPNLTFIFDVDSEKVRRMDDIFAQINSEKKSSSEEKIEDEAIAERDSSIDE